MKKFWQLKGDELTKELHGTELLKEYKRLIEYDDADQFLDFDTTLVIAYRDELENEKESLKSSELEQLDGLDEAFRHKTSLCIRSYSHRIAEGDPVADYLQEVITALKNYGKDQPSQKWWYHLFD